MKNKIEKNYQPERKTEQLNPTEFLEFRQKNAAEINKSICDPYYKTKTLSAEDVQKFFSTNPLFTKKIMFVLESFNKPKDPSKATRKDGSSIATHSLMLFKSAKDFFKIDNPLILETLLLHDIQEDTQVTSKDIKETLGEESVKLADMMTEKRTEKEGEESERKVGLVKFLEQIRQGGSVGASSELIDRMDDISDLKYLTDKIDKDPASAPKIKTKLIEKFGKCKFTCDFVAQKLEDKTTNKLHSFFTQLQDTVIKNLNTKYGLDITPEEIQKEIKTYPIKQ
jgi:(p)ppGpp synthase/HD superfamily hydrolase